MEPLIIERTINVPSGRVWQALTDPLKLKQWLSFFPDFKAEVGFRTEFELGPDKDHRYHHIVEVLEVVPEQKLTYTWDYGGMSTGSNVSFELSAQGSSTQLRLTCNFATVPTDDPDFLKNARGGWNYTADALQKFAENN